MFIKKMKLGHTAKSNTANITGFNHKFPVRTSNNFKELNKAAERTEGIIVTRCWMGGALLGQGENCSFIPHQNSVECPQALRRKGDIKNLAAGNTQ